ncbi:MAG: cation transporting ATPase C-terminal domain-containing protein, partial [Deltaproteobacteria bacterium]|nr:cation transporting ATPase C-terminal domain-containing protein [Deltaproteobacteria bacterium]
LLGVGSSFEVTLMGTLIGLLAFSNFYLFMGRSGAPFTFASVTTLQYAAATAISYATIVFCQYVNILQRRSTRHTLFSPIFFSNPILLYSTLISAGLVLILIYVPGIRDFLSFAPLRSGDWLYIFAAAGLYLFFFEVLKLVKRRISLRN